MRLKEHIGFWEYGKKTIATEQPWSNGKVTTTIEHQPGKTLWDWLQLLIIPLILTLATIGLGLWQAQLANEQHQNDQYLAQDQQREATLQTYLDNMSVLLLNDNLRHSKPEDEVRQVARERTLTTLRRLNADRNKIVLRFLQDARLIGIQNAVINLSNADLSGIDLSGADLRYASLSKAILNDSTLNGALMNDANLSDAILNGAILNGVILHDASLSNASLGHASLSYTNLSGANLSDVRNLTQQQLDGVYSCKNAILSTGLICHRN